MQRRKRDLFAEELLAEVTTSFVSAVPEGVCVIRPPNLVHVHTASTLTIRQRTHERATNIPYSARRQIAFPEDLEMQKLVTAMKAFVKEYM